MSVRQFVARYKYHIFFVLILLLTLKVIIPQLGDLVDTLKSLDAANMKWLALGAIVYFTYMPVSALQFMALSYKKLSFWLTYKVQMAVLFVSKLLPSYLGSIGLNSFYLIKQKNTPSQTAAVMTVDGLTSSIAFTTFIIIGLLTSSVKLKGLSGHINISANLIFFVLILLAGATYYIYRSIKHGGRLSKIWTDLKANFTSYKKRPMSVVAAIFCNGYCSLTSVFAMYASARAIGVSLSLLACLIAYCFGNIAANLIPTPGGIGAAEAGVYAGLVLVGVDGVNASAITLFYRLIVYWLPILPGYYFFWGLRKNLLSDYKIHKNYST